MSQDQDEDIVQRLRDWATIIDATKDRAAVVMLSGQTYVEAADEIERLRDEVTGLRKIVDGRFSSTTETVWRRDDFWR